MQVLRLSPIHREQERITIIKRGEWKRCETGREGRMQAGDFRRRTAGSTKLETQSLALPFRDRRCHKQGQTRQN